MNRVGFSRALLVASVACGLALFARPASADDRAADVDVDRSDEEKDGPFYKPGPADLSLVPAPPPPPPPTLAPSRGSAWLEMHSFVAGPITGTTSGIAARYGGGAGVGVFAGVFFNNHMFFGGIDAGRNYAVKLSTMKSGALYLLVPHFEMRIMTAVTQTHWVLGAGTSVTGLRYASSCGSSPRFTAEIRAPMINTWLTVAAPDATLSAPVPSVTLGALIEVGVF